MLRRLRRDPVTTTGNAAQIEMLEEALCRRIGVPRFQLWFNDKTRLAVTADAVVVGVPNHFYQEWLQKTFVEVVHQAAQEALGQALAVRFVIDAELFQAARRQETQVKTSPTAPDRAA